MSRIKCLALILMMVLLTGCLPPPPPVSPQPNPTNQAPTRTALAAVLHATLTAKAPTSTTTPTAPPTETLPPPTLTPTAQCTPTVPTSEILPMLAFVRLGTDGIANIVVRDLASGEERVLTHFAEAMGIFDLSWAPDGKSLVFVSAHNYLASRVNERNVFTVQSDGTGLRMITGDVMPPSEAIGPFVSVSGVISGTTAPCYVSAQGAASPVMANARGVFTLTGVPETADWVRAVCAPSETTSQAPEDSDAAMPMLPSYQGSISLADVLSTPLTITLPVSPGGQGWRQASLAPGGDRFCGVYYTWTLDIEGTAIYEPRGYLYEIETHTVHTIELPDGARIQDLAWSPRGDRIAGVYRLEQGSYLGLWDTNGRMLDTVLEIADTDSIIMTAKDLCWAPDGTSLAYALQQHYWWEDPTYKTEIWAVSLEDPASHVVTELQWGEHAMHPSWAADGRTLYYEFARAPKNEPSPASADYTLRAIASDGTGKSLSLLDGEPARLPAAHPSCAMGSPRVEDVMPEGGP
ncbi:MAG: hypothetical protein ACP5G7_03890 [Anaerolineae bacterium]